MEPIAIIIPTRNRYSNLRRCLLDLDKVDYPNKEILVICDDDLETYNSVMLNCPSPCKLFLTERLELVKATKFGIEQMKSDFFVYYNDDMMMDPKCLKIAIKEFQEKFKDGIGLIGFDDGINKFIGAVGLTNKKTVEKFDGWNPTYIHFWADTELGVRTRKAGCFYWSHDAKIDHLHPLVKKAPWDKTYEESHKHLDVDTVHFVVRNGVWVHRSREELEHES